MTTSGLRARLRLCVALGAAAVLLVNAPRIVDAQGLVKGVEHGAREGNKAAGPVGGVLGGAIGGVVGVVGGVVGAVTGGNNSNSGNNAKPANDKGGQPAASDKQGVSSPERPSVCRFSPVLNCSGRMSHSDEVRPGGCVHNFPRSPPARRGAPDLWPPNRATTRNRIPSRR